MSRAWAVPVVTNHGHGRGRIEEVRLSGWRWGRLGRKRRGFTLVEMVVVVAILGVVAGIVVYLVAGAQDSAETKALQAELSEIRKASQRFAADMGEPPRYLAELMQSPEPADSLGGWWWRTDGTPAPRLRSFDPAVARGWNGPYIKSEAVSSGTQEATESRLKTASTYESAASSKPQGKRLSILLSDYSKGQKKDGARLASHYQLDFTDSNEIFVRFVQDPLSPPESAIVVARLGLGVRP